MNKFKSVFVPFVEKNYYRDDKNNLIIPHSIVSDEIVDRDGEVVTAEAMREALDEYMQFGNIREMHQPIAIGKALKAWQDGKKTLIEAKIVAEEAIKKIEEGVLMGFSIGFKVLQKIGNTYTKIKIFEISAVDIPANYSALIGSKSYNPLLKEEEESMDKENENKDVAQVEATKEKPAETSTDTKVEVDTVKVEVSAEDLQDINKEALELVQDELNKVKAELEAVTKAKNELEIEVKSFEKTKEVAKSFKSLNLVHEKFKAENQALKEELADLKVKFEELKNKEVNIKTANLEGVVHKNASQPEIDFSEFEAKDVPSEMKNAVSLAKALIKLNK